MSSTKRQQTMAKIARERAVKERRAKKDEKKEEKKRARREAAVEPETGGEGPVDTPDPLDPYTAMLAQMNVSPQEAATLTHAELAARAVDSGVSRLTAERILALEQGGDDVGRARVHGQSRSWTGR